MIDRNTDISEDSQNPGSIITPKQQQVKKSRADWCRSVKPADPEARFEPYLRQLGDLLAHLQVKVLGIFHSDAGLEGHAAGR